MRNCLERHGDKLSNYTMQCDVSGLEKDLFLNFFLIIFGNFKKCTYWKLICDAEEETQKQAAIEDGEEAMMEE